MEAGATMVSYSRRALNKLLDELTKLESSKLVEEFSLDLESLEQGLLHKFAGRGPRDEQIKRWLKQVRGLVHDIQDWIDSTPKPKMKWGEDKTHPEVEQSVGRPVGIFGESERERIKKFKARILQTLERCERYDLLKKAPTDPYFAEVAASNVAIDCSRPLLDEKTGLVAVDGQKDELVRHLKDKKKMLKVVSIVGLEGHGKTTLAKEIYGELQGQFECQAFVSVGRRPSMKTTLMDILRQVKPEAYARDGSEYSDVQQVITELWEYLGTKRYFILVDDIWSIWAWKVINCALSDKNRGSRVLATTCVFDVAKSCSIHPDDVIYQMEALREYDSRSLFLSRISVREEERPADFEEVCDIMLTMCGGMPLAIIVGAGLLPRNSSELAQSRLLGNSSLSASDQYSSSQEMTKILHMSYDELSLPVKSCFLYLSVFPENCTIKKERLIRLWGAEGFIPRRDGESLWETGESCFNELISRRLIQPVFAYNDDRAVGCTVHGVILDFIRSLSREDNFVTTAAELSAGRFPCDTIRRYSLDCSNKEEADTLASSRVHLFSMRSLVVSGDVQRMPVLPAPTVSVLSVFKLVRVLDLEDTNNLGDHHLRGIGELVLLRYLGLRGTGIRELPEGIGEVRRLETLDLRGTQVRALPVSIVRSRKLVRLLLDQQTRLLTEFWEMEELEEVSTICADSSSSLNSVTKLLRESKRLRILGISLGNNPGRDREQELSDTGTYIQCVRSFLQAVRNSNLHSLSLSTWHTANSLGLLLKLFVDGPPNLRRFELKIFDGYGVVPSNIGSLLGLTHLHITIWKLVETKGLNVLGENLPSLVLLNLFTHTETESLRTRKLKNWIIKKGDFRCLEVLSFTCYSGRMLLKFQQGVMPQLRRLQLGFIARYGGNFNIGIQHLTCLTRVHATIECYHSRVSEVEAAEAAIRKQVSQILNKPTIEFTRHLYTG